MHKKKFALSVRQKKFEKKKKKKKFDLSFQKKKKKKKKKKLFKYSNHKNMSHETIFYI